MPVDMWFPTVVYREKFHLDPTFRQSVLASVADYSRDHVKDPSIRITATNAAHHLHFDPRVTPLFQLFQPH